MNPKISIIACFAIAAGLLLSGCLGGGQQGGGTGGGNGGAAVSAGTLKLQVTDARPSANISKIEVTFSQIEVHKATAEEENTTFTQCPVNCTPSGTTDVLFCGYDAKENLVSDFADECRTCAETGVEKYLMVGNFAGNAECPGQGGTEYSPAAGEWLSFKTEPLTYDLLQLQGVTQTIGEKQLAAGKYTQIRLVIDAVKVTENGIVKEAWVPSGKIRVVKPFEIKSGQTTTLTLDFDADKIVVPLGQGEYKVKPAGIKVVQQ